VKIRAALTLAAAVATTTLAANSTASADPLTDPAVRGQVAAILEYCARINPPGRETYRGLERQLLGTNERGGDEREGRGQGSAEFRKARDAAADALAGVPLDQALQTCKEATKG